MRTRVAYFLFTKYLMFCIRREFESVPVGSS